MNGETVADEPCELLVEQTPARRVARTSRPAWSERVPANEGLLGRSGSDMTSRCGDWVGVQWRDGGGDAPPGLATDRGVRETPGLSYGAAAQGIRQCWKHLPRHPEQEAFRKALRKEMLNLQI